MMIRESLKEEIDTLSEHQLWIMAEFMTSIKSHAQKLGKTTPFWQQATPIERAKEFREWTASLPKVGVSLSDETFDRDSIYENQPYSHFESKGYSVG